MRTRIAAAAVLFAAAVAHAGDPPKSPLEKAKAGQWVVQKTVAGGMTSYSYQWVSKVDGKKITLRSQLLNADQKTGMMAATEFTIDLSATSSPPSTPPATGPAPKTSEEEVEVKGKKVKAQKTEMTVSGMVSTSWVSDVVPISGLVKAVTKGADGKEVSVVEVVDFGDTGGADKPVGNAAAPGGGEATPAPAAGAKLAVGQRVGAKWKDKAWFAGKVTAVGDGTYDVTWDDGEQGTVPAADIFPCAEAKDLAVGDKVLAVWTNGTFYPGVVDKKTEAGCVIKWDDGDAPIEVPFGKIAKR